MLSKIRKVIQLASLVMTNSGRRALNRAVASVRGHEFAMNYSPRPDVMGRPQVAGAASESGGLATYFETHRSGRGIYKWKHYFEIYERHLRRFVGKEVSLCEIGVYSGGSLDMWKEYLGPGCRVYGIDIEKSCEAYADDRTDILIGDQADREFWSTVRKQVPPFDIVIDDGGHEPIQQIITLEEVLPHIARGGVYLCEDVHGINNPLAAYAQGLADVLNWARPFAHAPAENCDVLCDTHEFQRQIESVHFYPFVTVIEKLACESAHLTTAKRGTEWQPFL